MGYRAKDAELVGAARMLPEASISAGAQLPIGRRQ